MGGLLRCCEKRETSSRTTRQLAFSWSRAVVTRRRVQAVSPHPLSLRGIHSATHPATALLSYDISKDGTAGPSRPAWGVVGAGLISQDFCHALALAGSRIRAVAAREASAAAALAEKAGAETSYSSYAALLEDPLVSVVYIGAKLTTKLLPHSFLPKSIKAWRF